MLGNAMTTIGSPVSERMQSSRSIASRAFAIVFASLFIPVAVGADLVLHLGATTHRIALNAQQHVRLSTGDLHVVPVATSGVAGDGWCPTSGGTTPSGKGVVLDVGSAAIRIAAGSAATIDPQSGDVHVTPTATTGAAGDGWCPGGNGSPPVFTAALTATPSSLPGGGGNSTLSWATTGATSCTASATPAVAGWSGSKPVTGSVQVSLSATGTYSFSLACTGPGGATNAQPATVTVGAVSTECNNRPPPIGVARQSSMTNYNQGSTLNQQNSEFPIGAIINITNYSPLLGSYFNQPNQVARLFLDAGKYAAMGFTAAPLNASGNLSWEQVASGEFTVEISPCPGDFGFVTDPNCKASGIASALAWKVGSKPASNPGFYCYLDVNRIYYLNIIMASPGAWSTTTCGSPYCTWLVALGGT